MKLNDCSGPPTMPLGSNLSQASGHSQLHPPPNRGRGGASSGRKTHVGQGKRAAANRGISTTSQEESFQLLPSPGSPQRPFAMTIRLQPEILEKLKQAELEGIQPLMKFGTNASGHAIQVGHDTFKFSSVREPRDLCDIYEQKKGEVGDTVLVEAGLVWRKLSVQRFLSAKEKDRVKQRTAEAEKKQRQRKSILVDSSTRKVVLPGMGAEADGKKPMSKSTKEPPPKKQKVTNGPSATSSALKPKLSANADAATGSYQVASAFEPLAERTRRPFLSKGLSMQKHKSQTPFTTAPYASRKAEWGASITDLRSFLIRLLQENIRGVTIKTIEKAMAERLLVNPDKKVLEKVLRSIALYQAPGKYLLRPEVEKASSMDVVGHNESTRALEPFRTPEPFRALEPSRDVVVAPLNATALHAKHSIAESSLSKQNGAQILKGLTVVGSTLSSSSGKGSASGTDIDRTHSGTNISRFSISSGGTRTDDEYVNTMSDDEMQKKRELKRNFQVQESNLTAKEDSRRSRAILGKQRNYSDAHHSQQEGGLICGRTSNDNPAKDWERIGGGHEREPEDVDMLNHALRLSEGMIGTMEKARLDVMQSEKSLKDVDATRKDNDGYKKGMLKKAARVGRPPPMENRSLDSRRDFSKAEDLLDTTKSTNLFGSEFLAPYAKDTPDLRGPVNTHQEYKEYCEEYREKYPIYIKLHSTIVEEKALLKALRDDRERIRLNDNVRKLVPKMKKELSLHYKKCKCLLGAFRILHEELATLKRRCCEYAQKVGQG